MERWTFGVEPLPQQLVVAPLLRRVASLVAALEHDDPAVESLIADLRAAEQTLHRSVPVDAAPRLGDATAGRVYLDHSRDIGAYNPCFPEYAITVAGDHASGTVTFPLVFEGPAGVVHGGVLATFCDCVIQHHNCDAGVAGKTTSLLVEFHRPTPVAAPLTYEIERATDQRRISSRAVLRAGADALCTATMEAV